ncbi:hypothetical protein ACFPJ4_07095 [Lysinimonas soli]|uniref:Prevent-host-death protein n=1 Tax=Lysinimonas soli TaxID=1074233 RepID=A0ABW0NNZ2_9MICO
MDLLERATPLPLAAPHPAISVLALHGRLSRITRRDGTVLGYVEPIDSAEGERYRAKRLRARAQGFLVVGDFWTADEAVDALR